MASLKKPKECPNCLESESLRKTVIDHTNPNYEGWYCSYCISDFGNAIWPKAFITCRPKRNKNLCRVCGAERGKVEFVKDKNLCKSCASEAHKEYRKKNRGRLCKNIKDYWAKRDPKERWQRTRKTIQGSADAFLRDQMYHIKTRSLNPSKRDVKDVVRREFDLDGPYLLELWEKQGGVCALTGIRMTHQFGDMRAVSIDRIDSSKGHVRGNIQLICQCVNLMKNEHSNDEVVGFLDEYCRLRMKPVLDVST